MYHPSLIILQLSNWNKVNLDFFAFFFQIIVDVSKVGLLSMYVQHSDMS